MIPDGEIVMVLGVEREDDLKLKISFSDGSVRLVDFEPFLSQSKNPHIRRYLNPDLFGS